MAVRTPIWVPQRRRDYLLYVLQRVSSLYGGKRRVSWYTRKDVRSTKCHVRWPDSIRGTVSERYSPYPCIRIYARCIAIGTISSARNRYSRNECRCDQRRDPRRTGRDRFLYDLIVWRARRAEVVDPPTVRRDASDRGRACSPRARPCIGFVKSIVPRYRSRLGNETDRFQTAGRIERTGIENVRRVLEHDHLASTRRTGRFTAVLLHLNA